MSIVQDEKELEYWSDQKLLEEAQTPTGRMPLFLIHTQIEKRKNYRDSANARKQTPATSIYEEDVAEFGGGGLGSMQPQAGMGVAPMARGGLIRAEEGVHLPRKDLPTLMGDYRGTGRGNLTRKQIEELEKKIRSYKTNLKLSPFENVRKARNMSGGGLIRAQNSAYLNPTTIGNVLGVPTQEELKKQQEQIKEIQRQIALARKGEGGIPWMPMTMTAGGLALLTPWGKKLKQAKEFGQKIYQRGKAHPATAWAAKKYGQRVARKDPTKLLKKPAGSKFQPMPTTIAGGPKTYQAIGTQALKDINKRQLAGQLAGKAVRYGGAASLIGPGVYQTGKGFYDKATGRGRKTDQQVIDEVLKGLSKEDPKPTAGLPSITDSQSAEPEYRRFYSEYMQPEEEFQAELTDIESYRTTPEQRKNEATALAYSGLASALSNVGVENIIKGISEITPEVIALRKMQTEEQRVVDKNEADLRKRRRADRLMAINMQLEWEKMQNLRRSYEAAGKIEIWKAAYAAFTEQMPSKDMRSLDDFLYFFEFGEFPDPFAGLSKEAALEKEFG